MSKSHFQQDVIKAVLNDDDDDDDYKEFAAELWEFNNEKSLERGLKKAMCGFPNNNRRKTQGKPMYRWRWKNDIR